MNPIPEFVVEAPAAEQESEPMPTRERRQADTASAATLVQRDQVHALVQQLFFQYGTTAVRRVGFSGVDASADTAALCLEVAKALAARHRYDVGLIDAGALLDPLEAQLQLPVLNRGEVHWQVAPHLWMVPRRNWLDEDDGRGLTDRSLSRLHELTIEFDFSILWCAPVSWQTTSIARTCDGLVLVLSANRTRRFVALQAKEQLSKARVPLLGTVLADRRFPVPQGLYESL